MKLLALALRRLVWFVPILLAVTLVISGDPRRPGGAGRGGHEDMNDIRRGSPLPCDAMNLT
jgi:hypothetical protein